MAIILLVHDDPLRASAYRSALSANYPDVRRVRFPFEALVLVEEQKFAHELKLVIYSHTMIGITGPGFVEELHSRVPTIKVLVLDCPQNDKSRYPKITHFAALPGDAAEVLPLVADIMAEPKPGTIWPSAA